MFTQHPTELFQNKRFAELIEKVKTEFDQVIIDTPPILPVSDALLIARHCDIKLFVVSASKDTISEVKQAVKKARSHGIDIDGMILNHRKPLVPYGSRQQYKYTYATEK